MMYAEVSYSEIKWEKSVLSRSIVAIRPPRKLTPSFREKNGSGKLSREKLTAGKNVQLSLK